MYKNAGMYYCVLKFVMFECDFPFYFCCQYYFSRIFILSVLFVYIIHIVVDYLFLVIKVTKILLPFNIIQYSNLSEKISFNKVYFKIKYVQTQVQIK